MSRHHHMALALAALLCAEVCTAPCLAGCAASAASEDAREEAAAETSENAGEGNEATSTDAPLAERNLGSVVVVAPQSFDESGAYANLTKAMDAFWARGYRMGFVLTDLQSGRSISYNAHALYYPASAIKGPYVLAFGQATDERGGTWSTRVSNYVERTIVYSDNDSYGALFDYFGGKSFASWAKDSGAQDSSSAELSTWRYPMVSAADMAALWQRGYEYLKSGAAHAQEIAGVLARRDTSPIADALGNDTTSWSKAGWFYNPEDDEYGRAQCTTSDCGIVFAKSGIYVLAFLSDAPGDFDAAATLIRALDSAHDALVL